MAVDKNPQISVIIPARNYGSFLVETIDSVLCQTYPPEEVIVIDDGSEDNTAEIVRNFSPDVKYIFLDKRGVGAARNSGVKNSSGEYIAHLDADDIWVPEKLDIQINEFRNNSSLEIAGGMMQPFYDPGMDPAKRKMIYCSETPLPGFSASVLIVKREAFFKVGFYREDLELGQDLDWFIRAREIGLKEKMVEKLLAYRRLHENNSSMIKKNNRIERLRVLKESIDRRRVKEPSGKERK